MSIETTVGRRSFIAGSLATAGVLALPGCATYGGGGISLTEAIRRLLLLSSERAFVRMTAPGGFWDQQVATLGLGDALGARGDVLGRVLTSALFKQRLEREVAEIAVDASYRAAPIVTDAVRTIGFANAVELIRGGPTAASSYLKQEIGFRLVEALVPEVGSALRLAEDPLMGELLGAMTGLDIPGIANRFSGRINDVIWSEIGREESAIRADPRSSGDPLLAAVLTANGAF